MANPTAYTLAAVSGQCFGFDPVYKYKAKHIIKAEEASYLFPRNILNFGELSNFTGKKNKVIFVFSS